MAAMMSGLEGRLFPRSLSRGRESSRGSSRRRSSSLDSRSPPSAPRLSRSASPTNRTTTHNTHRTLTSESQPTISNTENTLKMEGSHNKSDEALVKPSGSMPSYVQPTEHGESGERLAKDVFDRDNNLIESSSSSDDDEDSDDDDYEGSDEEESIPGVTFVTVPRGRTRNKKDDITAITASDFTKPKDGNLDITEQRKYQPLSISLHLSMY